MARGRFRFCKIVVPVTALLLALPLLPETASARNGGISPLTISLPAARSGQPYFWALKAEGGVKPYRCTPLNLHIGTLALNALCQITGRAPITNYESITGPFIFKLHDSSKPPKTIEFSPMNFMTLAKATPPTSTTTSTTSTTTSTTSTTTTTITLPSVEGTWTGSTGYQIAVRASGSGFVGSEVTAQPTAGSPCTHPAGQQIWQINVKNQDGSYSGEAQGWTWTIGGDSSTCVVTPYPVTYTISGPTGGKLQMAVDYTSLGETFTFTRPANS